MGDTLKKVQPGDPLTIPAATFNTFVDVARDCQNRQRTLGQGASASFAQSGIVRIKNSSGAARNRFEVLGIGGVLLTPSDNEDYFYNSPRNGFALEGETPGADSYENFAILLEPVAYASIGLACAGGLCPVQIDVTDANHQWAIVDPGDVTSLDSSPDGSCRIIWKESGTGLKWAVVYVGMQATPVRRVFLAKITTSYGGGVYAVRQQGQNGSTSFFDWPGGFEVTATNVAEMAGESSSPLPAGAYVMVMGHCDNGSPRTWRYVFDRPTNAYYKS